MFTYFSKNRNYRKKKLIISQETNETFQKSLVSQKELNSSNKLFAICLRSKLLVAYCNRICMRNLPTFTFYIFLIKYFTYINLLQRGMCARNMKDWESGQKYVTSSRIAFCYRSIIYA